MLNYKNKSQSYTEIKRKAGVMHNLKTAWGDVKLLSAAGRFVCVCRIGGRGSGEEWRREVPQGVAVTYGQPLGPQREEEEGGEWALGVPVEGVGGGEGLPPTVPDRAICFLSWVIVRSSFSRASRSLRNSSCSSCRSASARSSLWRSSDNWKETQR